MSVAKIKGDFIHHNGIIYSRKEYATTQDGGIKKRVTKYVSSKDRAAQRKKLIAANKKVRDWAFQFFLQHPDASPAAVANEYSLTAKEKHLMYSQRDKAVKELAKRAINNEPQQETVEVPSNDVDPLTVQVAGHHYKDMTVQPWEVISLNFSEQEALGYFRGTALKYIMRAGTKGPVEEDLEKAQHVLQYWLSETQKAKPDANE